MKSSSDFLKIHFYYFKCVCTCTRMCLHVSVGAVEAKGELNPLELGLQVAVSCLLQEQYTF